MSLLTKMLDRDLGLDPENPPEKKKEPKPSLLTKMLDRDLGLGPEQDQIRYTGAERLAASQEQLAAMGAMPQEQVFEQPQPPQAPPQAAQAAPGPQPVTAGGQPPTAIPAEQVRPEGFLAGMLQLPSPGQAVERLKVDPAEVGSALLRNVPTSAKTGRGIMKAAEDLPLVLQMLHPLGMVAAAKKALGFGPMSESRGMEEATGLPFAAEDRDLAKSFEERPLETLASLGAENASSLAVTLLATSLGGPPGGYVAAFVQEFGSAYDEAPDDIPAAQKWQAAAGTASINAGLEYLGAKYLKGLGEDGLTAAKKVLVRRVMRPFVAAAIEGGTEGVQTVNQQFQRLAAYVGDPGISLADLKLLTSPEYLEETLASTAGGAVLAGGVATVQGARADALAEPGPQEAISEERAQEVAIAEGLPAGMSERDVRSRFGAQTISEAGARAAETGERVMGRAEQAVEEALSRITETGEVVPGRQAEPYTTAPVTPPSEGEGTAGQRIERVLRQVSENPSDYQRAVARAREGGMLTARAGDAERRLERVLREVTTTPRPMPPPETELPFQGRSAEQRLQDVLRRVTDNPTEMQRARARLDEMGFDPATLTQGNAEQRVEAALAGRTIEEAPEVAGPPRPTIPPRESVDGQLVAVPVAEAETIAPEPESAPPVPAPRLDRGVEPAQATETISEPATVTQPTAERVAPAEPTQAQLTEKEAGFFGRKPKMIVPKFSPAVEKAIAEGRAGSGPSLVSKALATMEEAMHAMTRSYRHLEGGARYVPVREALRMVEGAGGRAVEKVSRRMRAALDPLTNEQYDLFEKKMLNDNAAEAIRLHGPTFKLPQNLTPAEVQRMGPELDRAIQEDARVAASQGAQRPSVERAIQDVRQLWLEARQEVEAAIKAEDPNADTDWLWAQGDAYMHHRVLEYNALENLPDVGSGVRQKRRGFRKKKKGTEKTIAMRYMRTQGEVLSQLFLDAEVARQRKAIRDKEDIKASLQAQHGKDWRQNIPSTHVIRQLDPGSKFAIGHGVSERAFNRVLRDGFAEITGKDIKDVLIKIGPKEEWVIPKEVARTLDDLEQASLSAGLPRKFLRRVQNKWKEWQLLSPRRSARYMFRNAVSDMTKAVTWSPTVVKQLPRASKELFQYFRGRENVSDDLLSFMAHGGVGGTLSMQELNATEESRMRQLSERDVKRAMDLVLAPVKAPVKATRAWFRKARQVATFMESLTRYASYLDYKSQLERNNGKPMNWGASIPEEIMALETNEQKAYWLSNELLGAYDQVSEGGRFIREQIMPFWSFQELNLRSHYRLWKNAIADEGMSRAIAKRAGLQIALRSPFLVAKAVKFYGLAMAFEAFLSVANHLQMALLDDDELEDDVPEDVRRRPHILLGRREDGSARYFDRLSVFAEFRDWFQVDTAIYNIQNYLDGRMTKRDIAQDMALGLFDKIWNQIGPLSGLGLKTGAELATRRSGHPSVTRSRRISDIPDYLARSFGLEKEFRALTGRPQRGGSYGATLSDLLVYSSEPGQPQYYDILTLLERYLRSKGDDSAGASWGSKTEALRKYKQAVQYGQRDVAMKFLALYEKLGGDEDGVEASVRRMSPTYGLDDEELQDFRKWLKGDVEMLDKAIEYYEKTLAKSDDLLYRYQWGRRRE